MYNNLSSQKIDALLSQLQSDKNGLTNTVAAQRLQKQNLTLKTESRFKRELKLFISQFTNPLVLLLVVAIILSAVLGQASDTIIISFILFATGFLSFLQELNAGRAVEKLQKMIELKHRILREGKEVNINTNEVVPGDILLLEAGDIIPADCRIIESNELHVNESALTGESFPVEKAAGEWPDDTSLSKKTNCLWQSSNIISGTAKALVVNTAKDTVFGQMAHSLVQTSETAFEKGIKHFGFFLLQITIVLSIVILATNIYFGKPLFDSVLFSLALAIGMAPELLPAIMTFAMSAGAKRMLKKKVIVKKLSSIFNFGEVNILCTDKTGTITEGEVKVKNMVNINGAADDQVRLFASLNSTFQNGFANPIDDAIKALGENVSGYQKLNEVPYDFIRKLLSVAVKQQDNTLMVTKGALTNVLDVCTFLKNDKGEPQPFDEEQKKKAAAFYANSCQQGLRVLGVCYKNINKEKITRDDEKEMIFAGYILLEDPLKESSLASIKRLEEMNVKIKIITGDNRYSAGYTAKKLGIANPVIIAGDELNTMLPEALVVRAAQTDIFAEIEPSQKERIVKALQKSNLVVAYMGDGINDVAAIHAADVGISTSNAVDVAKEAADFVLMEKDLSVLADGIYEGRKSFVNSMKYIFINTGATFGNMFSVAGASLLLPFLPMLPKQILLTNFLTDLPYLSVASDNVDEDELTTPRKWNMKLLRNFMIVFGLHSSLFDFITFFVLYYYFHLANSQFQTGWFLESVVTELIILFVIRTKKSFIRSVPGKFLVYTSLLAFVITILLPVSPFAGALGLSLAHTEEALAIAGILVAYALTADWVKILFFRAIKDKSSY